MVKRVIYRMNMRILETLPCTAVIDERKRMAREIHDTLAQEFAGILLHLEALKGSNSHDWEKISRCLARASELAKCGLEDARRLVFGLRPKSLDGAGLFDALQQLAGRFSRDWGIHCAFTASGRARNLPEEVENELYRVAQEALCNVRKHSRACSVSMVLAFQPDGVVLGIKDNGQGFVPARQQAGVNGFGLPAMHDRAQRLGGKMDINTAPGTGTELRMRVPLAANNSNEKNH
jgi:signal transduction histidine kinase